MSYKMKSVDVYNNRHKKSHYQKGLNKVLFLYTYIGE